MIASAGSRYTYSANTMAYKDLEKAEERIALGRHVVPVVDRRRR